jgi:hypothetical protein
MEKHVSVESFLKKKFHWWYLSMHKETKHRMIETKPSHHCREPAIAAVIGKTTTHENNPPSPHSINSNQLSSFLATALES